MEYNGIELVPVTEVQAFEETKDMLVWNEGSDNITTRGVSAIIKIYIDNLKVVCSDYNLYDYCAEIPTPQKREMNSLEVMEYLHLLQLYLDNGGQGNPCSLELPIIDGRNASDYKFGVVVTAHTTLNKWHRYTTINYGTGMFDNKFGILKNGKVTEFKPPQVEVTN